MPEDNVTSSRSQGFRGPHVGLLSEAQHFPPNQPAGAQPPGCPNKKDQGQERDSLPDRERQQQDKQAGNGEGPVYQPHQHRIDPPSPVAGKQPHRCTNRRREDHRKQRYAEGNAGTGYYSSEHVATELIGTEWMAHAGWQATCKDIRLGQGISEKDGTYGRGDRQEEENEGGDPAAWLSPDLMKRDGRVHANRTRGSRSAYARSVSRPPVTTRAATSTDAPIRRG